jgi:hypothetical protein
MTMQKFTVDGVNSRLIAKAGVTEVDVQVDLYSDAKEHWLTTDDSKFEFPFRTVAGDPIGGGKYVGDHYFLGNGWKIRPQEADHTLSVDGNLWLDEGETGEIFVPTVGAFTVLALIERSADAIGVSEVGLNNTALTAVALAVWNIADEVEAGVSPIYAMRALCAVLAGLVTGGPANPAFRGIGRPIGASPRVEMTADSSGNRSLVNLDLA